MRKVKCVQSKDNNFAICKNWTGTGAGTIVCNNNICRCIYEFSFINYLKAVFE